MQHKLCVDQTPKSRKYKQRLLTRGIQSMVRDRLGHRAHVQCLHLSAGCNPDHMCLSPRNVWACFDKANNIAGDGVNMFRDG